MLMDTNTNSHPPPPPQDRVFPPDSAPLTPTNNPSQDDSGLELIKFNFADDKLSFFQVSIQNIPTGIQYVDLADELGQFTSVNHDELIWLKNKSMVIVKVYDKEDYKRLLQNR